MSATIVSSWNEFDPLKHVIVGRADHTCIPPDEPATQAKIPEDSDMRGMWGTPSIGDRGKGKQPVGYAGRCSGESGHSG